MSNGPDIPGINRRVKYTNDRFHMGHLGPHRVGLGRGVRNPEAPKHPGILADKAANHIGVWATGFHPENIASDQGCVFWRLRHNTV